MSRAIFVVFELLRQKYFLRTFKTSSFTKKFREFLHFRIDIIITKFPYEI